MYLFGRSFPPSWETKIPKIMIPGKKSPYLTHPLFLEIEILLILNIYVKIEVPFLHPHVAAFFFSYCVFSIIFPFWVLMMTVMEIASIRVLYTNVLSLNANCHIYTRNCLWYFFVFPPLPGFVWFCRLPPHCWSLWPSLC